MKDRHCALETNRDGRKADRKMYGVTLDAIVAVLRRNGYFMIRDNGDEM